MARVVLENLSKVFKDLAGAPVHALDEANLAIEDRELLVLVGPSGCGKTTTLRLIAGLEVISSGTISIEGQIVNNIEPKERDVAMVFQNHALYPHMTVYQNMAFGLKLRHFPKEEIQRRVKEAAQILGLTPYLERKPQALSGGQRQRVAVGRAIVRQPKVFLFDEPLSNLDPPMRVQMRAELARLHKELQATMVYVTHDQLEAMTLGDRIAVMNDGVVQQVGEPLTIYHAPRNVFVARFIGSPPMNLLKGTLRHEAGACCFLENNPLAPLTPLRVRLPEAAANALAPRMDQEITMGIRPEHLAIASGDKQRARFSAHVEVVERLGSETLLYASTAAHRLIARVPGDHRFEPREKVELVFAPHRAHFFDVPTGVRLEVPG